MRRLLLPGLLLAAAVAFDREWLGASLPDDLDLLQIVRGFSAVAFLLAWRFRSGRIAAAAILLAATAEILALHPPLDGSPPGGPWLPAAGILLPLNLLLLAVLEEWRVLSKAGLLRFAALGAQGAAAVYLSEKVFSEQASGTLRTVWIESLPTGDLPQSALACFAVAAIVLIVLVSRRGTPVDAGLLGALAAAFAAFELAERPLLPMIAGGSILALSQIDRAFAFAFEDTLTGLPARRALEQRLRQLGRRYAIGMVDIDHFKRLNDRHGHDVGDQVLRLVGSRLARVSGGGTAFRYGGEEFAVLFPGKSAKDAKPHLEALRSAIADHPFAVRSPARPRRKPKRGAKTGARGAQGKRLKVTVSLGVADRNARRTRPEQVMKAADRALYRSKKAGRNRLTGG